MSSVDFHATSTTVRERVAPPSFVEKESRKHRRLEISLLGRFMRENKQEYPCRLCDISVGGAAFQSPIIPPMGERIVAYFDHIGGIEGHVVRLVDRGFAIELIATPHKREKLAAQITWLINRNEFGDAGETRRYARQASTATAASLTLAEGIKIQVKVLDISMSGASIATEARPPLGAAVKLGKLNATVVRHHADGIAVQFIDIQQPEAVRRYFG
jgi:hypothetical protein